MRARAIARARSLARSHPQAVAEGGGAAEEVRGDARARSAPGTKLRPALSALSLARARAQVWATYARMRRAGVRLRGDPYPYTLVCRALGDYKQARDLSSRARAALGRAIYQS